MKNFNFLSSKSKVIHKTNEGIFAEDYNSLNWEVIEKIPEANIPLAVMRAKVSINKKIDLLTDNCEHFARFITEGQKQSKQVQAFGVILGGVLTYFLLKD